MKLAHLIPTLAMPAILAIPAHAQSLEDGCAASVLDWGNPSNCLRASSVPRLGHLFPLSRELFIRYPQNFVGIGTTEPTATLEVAGDVRIKGTTPWADVMAYGAVGDNVADDTAAIQRALIEVWGAGGGTVFVPRGTYRHTGLKIRSNVHLVGVGPKASVLNYVPSEGDALSMVNNDARNIQIRSIKFTSEGRTSGTAIQGPPGPMGFRWEVTDFRMEDYEIENFRHGMFLPDSLNAKIGRGRWLGQGRNLTGGLGVYVKGHGVVIEQAYVSDYDRGVYLDAPGSTVISPIFERCNFGLKTQKISTISSGWFMCYERALEAGMGGWVLTNPHIIDPVTFQEIADPFANGQITFLGPTAASRSITLHKGKSYMPGGVDPPYVSFSNETHDSIKGHAVGLTDHENAMLFWNNDAGRMEVYVKDEDAFKTLGGQPLADRSPRQDASELLAENERLRRKLADYAELERRVEQLERTVTGR